MNEPGDDRNDLDKVAETLARESNISKDIIIKNVNKTYPISKTDEKGLQHRIVKFTSDSFKGKVFKKQEKKIIENQKKKNQSMLKSTCNLY